MNMIRVSLFDAFTDRPFGGNIAGVVTDAGGLSDEQMAAIANELGAPTTGFAEAKGRNDFQLRFFTPSVEVDMCGHVVVGTCTALAEEGRVERGGSDRAEIRLQTRAGEVPVEISFGTGSRVEVTMTQRRPTFRDPEVQPETVAGLLGIGLSDLNLDYPMEIACTGLRHLFVPVKGLRELASLRPDFPSLAALSRQLEVDTVGVFTLETGDPRHTLRSRDLSPAIGNNEESASGTTNGALSCYLVKNGILPDVLDSGRHTVLAEQGYEMGRPSLIRCEIAVEAGRIEAVRVGGTARRALKGELHLE